MERKRAPVIVDLDDDQELGRTRINDNGTVVDICTGIDPSRFRDRLLANVTP